MEATLFSNGFYNTHSFI